MYSNEFYQFPVMQGQSTVHEGQSTVHEGQYTVHEGQSTVHEGLVTLKFPCHKTTVGTLVGTRWSRVKQLSIDFRAAFSGFDIDVSHDGNCFNVVMANFSDGVMFVTNTFGEEISLANHGIEIRSQFVGRMIGKGGHNLRDIEAGAGTKCTIYHEDGLFWMRFPCDTPVEARREALEYTKGRIFDYADFLEDRLVDSWASETSSETASEASETSSETASEASFSSATSSETAFPAGASYTYDNPH
tara:strand:+ start:347 stop:1081 length:735 start_codon:yes stop_codon:yes gene_type:complete